MSLDQQRLQARLDELIRRHRVPGAALAVIDDGQLIQVASGVLNVETGVEATPDSLFQIGSVTKSYTATVVMQLVERGLLDLDEPVVKALPELRLADQAMAEQVTMRHLLSHTSGIQGDHFEDFGRGDDVLARYVDSCATLGFSHPVGATMSYCNTGYGIAGRVVERLTDQTWDDALAERVIRPLELQHTVTLPEQALRFRVAHGHVAKSGESPHLAPTWTLPRSLGPAGLICATVADMVAFGRLHLDDGRTPGGAPVIAAATAESMRQPAVEIPDPWTLGRSWGLGWILFDWDDRVVYGHDGSTIGQAASLRVVPDSGVVVGLLANGGHVSDLYRELFPELMGELCGLRMPPPLTPPDEPPTVETAAHAGRYERLGVRFELEDRDGTLAGKVVSTGPLAEIDEEPVEDITLVPVSDDLFVSKDDDQQTWTPLVFYRLADGSRYLHTGARATPKISDTQEAT